MTHVLSPRLCVVQPRIKGLNCGPVRPETLERDDILHREHSEHQLSTVCIIHSSKVKRKQAVLLPGGNGRQGTLSSRLQKASPIALAEAGRGKVIYSSKEIAFQCFPECPIYSRESIYYLVYFLPLLFLSSPFSPLF